MQEFRVFPRNRKPQARAAEFAGNRAVRLLKRLEHNHLLFLRDADAGIADGNQNRVFPRRMNGRRERHRALFREFEGIRQQIADNLREFVAVGLQNRINILPHDKFQPLFVRNRMEQVFERLEQFADAEFRDVHRHFSGLDFAQIENVVNQPQQLLSGLIDDADLLDLFLVQMRPLVFAEHFGKQNNRVERRPQFVRHVRQKFRLVFARQFQFFGAVIQFAFGFVRRVILLAKFLALLMKLLLLLFKVRIDLLQFLALLLQFLLLLLKPGVRLPHFPRLLLRLFFGLLRLLRGDFGGLLRLLRDAQQFLHFFALLRGKQDRRNDAVRLVQKILRMRLKRLRRGQFDDAVQRVFIQQRERVRLRRRVADRAGRNQRVLPRLMFQENRRAFERDLPDNALAEPIDVGQLAAFGKCERAEQPQRAFQIVVGV